MSTGYYLSISFSLIIIISVRQLAKIILFFWFYYIFIC